MRKLSGLPLAVLLVALVSAFSPTAASAQAQQGPACETDTLLLGSACAVEVVCPADPGLESCSVEGTLTVAGTPITGLVSGRIALQRTAGAEAGSSASGSCAGLGSCEAHALSNGSPAQALPGETLRLSCSAQGSLGVLIVAMTCATRMSPRSSDTAPPDTTILSGPSGVTNDPTPTFTFASNEEGARFECRLDNGPWFACSSPYTTPPLADGPHSFEVRAVDRAGNVDPSPASALNVSAARRSFTVVESSPGLPPPELGRTFNAEPLSGEVLVSVPARAARAAATVPGLKGRSFVPLGAARQLPVGSLLDTRRGKVRLTSARNTRGAIQSGDFLSGVFQVLQSRKRSAGGLTELRLKGASFRGCGSAGGRRARSAGSHTRAQGAQRRSRRVVRRVRGSASGRFRTSGRYSSATVRGTDWDTTDRCDGTLTRVQRGQVVVRDFRRRRSIVLSAGDSHLASRAGASTRRRATPPARSATCPAPRGASAIVGSGRRDLITGTNGADVILGLAGNDRVSGGAGSDCQEGNGGSDQLDGSNGHDRLLGGAGPDVLSGGLGRDRLEGGSGRDRLSGGHGSDVLLGGTGRDRVQGGFGNDRLIGGAGNDGIHTGNGRDRVAAGPGDDIVNAATNGPPASVDCGPGRDRVRINNDERQRIQDCELVDVFRRILR